MRGDEETSMTGRTIVTTRIPPANLLISLHEV